MGNDVQRKNLLTIHRKPHHVGLERNRLIRDWNDGGLAEIFFTVYAIDHDVVFTQAVLLNLSLRNVQPLEASRIRDVTCIEAINSQNPGACSVRRCWLIES